MTERLRSDFWVSAYLRRCAVEGCDAVLARRGAAEAGAVFVIVDRLDGYAVLYGPASQTAFEGRPADRLFTRVHKEDVLPRPAVLERLRREQSFDPDLWVVEVEDRQGRNFLDLAG